MPRLPFSILSLTLICSLLACGGGASRTAGFLAVGPADASDHTDTTTATTAVPKGLAVVVDIDTPIGAFRDLLGVNKPPMYGDKQDKSVIRRLPELYKAFGISQSRLHDARVDNCQIYQDAVIYDAKQQQEVSGCVNQPQGGPPHVIWKPGGDVADMLNYDFTLMDEATLALEEAGVEGYLRLGESYNGPNDTDNTEKWAQIAANIYRHAMGSFGAGQAMAPRYVEVYNEPDGMFWVGTNASFMLLFSATVAAVRKAAEQGKWQVKIGGAGFVHGVTKKIGQSGSLAHDFFDLVSPGDLDFVSAHYYGQCADASLSDMAKWLQTFRKQVDARGFASKPLHITEWNIGLGKKCGQKMYAGQRLQSFVSGGLTLMQDEALDIEAAHFYAGVTVMSLFSPGKGGGPVVNPSAWAFWAHRHLRGGQRLSALTCLEQDCKQPLQAPDRPLLAVAAQNGKKVFVVVTNDTAQQQTATLQLQGAALAGRKVTIVTPPAKGSGGHSLQWTEKAGVQRLDQGAVDKLIASVQETSAQTVPATAGASYALSLTLEAHSLQLVELAAD